MTTLPLAEPSRRSQDALLGSAKLWGLRRISWRLAWLWKWLTLGRRIFWLELCSVVPRMRISRTATLEGGYDFGPLFEQSTERAGLVLNNKTQLHILGEERFLTKYPWATEADLQLFFEGLDMGEAFYCGSPRKTETAAAHSVEEC